MISHIISAVKRIGEMYSIWRMRKKTTEEIFGDIFKMNGWGSDESISGPGSDLNQTRKIIAELPLLLKELDIQSILDIPCGDFNWMKFVDLHGLKYIGADIVSDLIEQNTKLYEKGDVRFQKIDLINDSLPEVDLIMVRDCFVHLSLSDIRNALSNVCKSQAKYLLTTTFSDRRKNIDIATGQWRTLNFEISPFFFPLPLKMINEQCTECDGGYADKSLALWKIDDIRGLI